MIYDEMIKPILPTMEPMGYENTIFKEMSDDIKSSYEKRLD